MVWMLTLAQFHASVSTRRGLYFDFVNFTVYLVRRRNTFRL